MTRSFLSTNRKYFFVDFLGQIGFCRLVASEKAWHIGKLVPLRAGASLSLPYFFPKQPKQDRNTYHSHFANRKDAKGKQFNEPAQSKSWCVIEGTMPVNCFKVQIIVIMSNTSWWNVEVTLCYLPYAAAVISYSMTLHLSGFVHIRCCYSRI